MKTYIKAPNGRIVAAGREYFVEKANAAGVIDLAFDAAKLKDGWSLATAADLKAAEDAEAKRAAAEKKGA